MKYIFREDTAEYNSYKFPYLVYAQLEKEDSVDAVLTEGFLPTRIAQNMFYKARSVRINVAEFELSSENRRIASKTSYLSLSELKITEATQYAKQIIALAKDYYTQKFGKQIISEESLRKILLGEMFTHLLIYTDTETNTPVGYTIMYKGESSAYYAYPIYDMTYYSRNIGIGMMQMACSYYKMQGMQWLYIGTAYTAAAKYKLQFSPLQWNSGNTWQSDVDALKTKLTSQS